MVAMSGKGSEPRGSSGNSRKQQSSQSGPSSKPKPTAEALHLARILEGTSYPADMKDRIQQVAGVVPNKSEEEICVALHDHDYNPERAITWLLDADANQGEWTTSGRKGKKKGPLDTIVAPGDNTGAAKTSGGTNRAASTRESHGGSVVVTRDGRGKARGRSNFGRGRNDKGGRGERGDRPRHHSKGKWDEQSAPPTTTATTAVESVPQAAEKSWDQPQAQIESSEDVWQQQQQQTEGTWDVEQESVPEWEKPSVTPQDPVTWREELAPPIFPEALPTQTTAATTTGECVVSTSGPLQLCTPSSDVSHDRVTVESEAKSKRLKQKRLARSQIPSKPVEMPVGMASIDVQFSTLGIDFVGARSLSPVDRTHPDTQQKVETSSGGGVAFPNTRQQSSPDQYSVHQQIGPLPPGQLSKDTTQSTASRPLTSPPILPPAYVLASSSESIAKPTIVASRAVPLTALPITGSGSGLGAAALPMKDVHIPMPPRETIAVHSEASSSSSSILTQQQTAAEIVRASNNALSFPDQSVRPSSQISPSSMPSSSVAVMPGLSLSNAVAMGNLQQTSSAAAPHTSAGVGGGYMHSMNVQGSGLLPGGSVVSKAVTSAQAAIHANVQVATHTSAQAALHTNVQVATHTSAQTAHTSAQAVHSAKLAQGPPGFQMYSQLMQPGYYMPNMPGYYTTPDTVPRYQPAYYHQPGTTDPSMGGTAISRDHVASSFADQSKYATKMGEGTSPVVSNTSHQQQQQQGLQTQLGPAAYLNMGTYPQSHPYAGFYYPAPWFSAPSAPMAKAPTNSFSNVGGAYQTHLGNMTGYDEVNAAAHEYTKYNAAAAAAMGKPVADSDLSTAFKQPSYDSKPVGGNAFNNYGLLQMPPGSVPMQMVPQHNESMQQSRGQQTRHPNKPTGGYGGGWPQSSS